MINSDNKKNKGKNIEGSQFVLSFLISALSGIIIGFKVVGNVINITTIPHYYLLPHYNYYYNCHYPLHF